MLGNISPFRWKPDENDNPHQMNGEGWPGFSDGVDDMVAAVGLKPAEIGCGYIIEWQVNADPCLEIAPGQFWGPDPGEVRMGLNLAVADLDYPEDSADNWLNIYHENWWSGEKDKRTWLKQWGTMILYPGARPDTEEQPGE